MQGRAAVITGGTRGIGKAIAQNLVHSGAHVIVNYLSDHESAKDLEDSLQDAPGTISVHQCHLGDREAREKFWSEVDSQLSEVNYLILNAATGVHRPTSSLSSNSFRKVLSVNLEANLDFIKEGYKRMPSGAFSPGEKGRVIALSSLGAQRALRDYGSVGVSKAALEAMMRQFASELGVEGVNFNIVRPGLVDTGILDYLKDRAKILEDTIARTPNRRLVQTREVAQLVHFLLSENSAMINGQTIDIDGGFGISE